jgi:hypothetical protein
MAGMTNEVTRLVFFAIDPRSSQPDGKERG